MRAMKRPALFAAATGLAALPAAVDAAELSVSVEIPRLAVAEYHRPYVALWIEGADEAAVKTLAVWYDTKLPKKEGNSWLKDMRQWWRKAGRGLTLPADGLSGPTKAPGKQQVVFTGADLSGLAPGSYTLSVEAAREVGGREIIRVPFAWPPKAGAKPATVSGTSELGAITVATKP